MNKPIAIAIILTICVLLEYKSISRQRTNKTDSETARTWQENVEEGNEGKISDNT